LMNLLNLSSTPFFNNSMIQQWRNPRAYPAIVSIV
jgi:hypothetical protein